LKRLYFARCLSQRGVPTARSFSLSLSLSLSSFLNLNKTLSTDFTIINKTLKSRISKKSTTTSSFLVHLPRLYCESSKSASNNGELSVIVKITKSTGTTFHGRTACIIGLICKAPPAGLKVKVLLKLPNGPVPDTAILQSVGILTTLLSMEHPKQKDLSVIYFPDTVGMILPGPE